ncbi:MAG: dihydropteroate synthase [Actinomycetota bacterium]|jgi:dihydropteroate synthase
MSWQKPKVMGVINVTPDSFSDGGKFLSLEDALAQARLLVAQGAEILDVGGESTRPGAGRITIQEEQARALPVIHAIKQELSVSVSIDTLNSDTAQKAIQAGADIINDVSGGLADPNMFSAIANTNCLYVLGHWRGFSDVMDDRAVYSDVAREVVAELAEQVSMAVASGISRDRIIVDPGLGFAKDMKQNWDLVARLDELKKLDLPILVGASRKRFIAHALNKENPQSVDHSRRDVATAVLTALLLQRKLWGVRVHNVQATVDAISVVAALKEAEQQ